MRYVTSPDQERGWENLSIQSGLHGFLNKASRSIEPLAVGNAQYARFAGEIELVGGISWMTSPDAV